MDITKQQKDKIRSLSQQAQRRMRRASGGQRRYMESSWRRATGQSTISGKTKGLTERQAAAKIRQLEKFLDAKTTTKRGWKNVVSKSVASANETWGKRGYNLTDDELADILEQVDSEKRGEYYKTVNLVQAAKDRGEVIDYERIGELVRSKKSAATAMREVLKNRNLK